MATITINIPDEYVNRVLDAFDGTYAGRTRWVDGELVELYTEAQWAKRHVIRYVRQIVHQYECRVAADAIAEVPGIE